MITKAYAKGEFDDFAREYSFWEHTRSPAVYERLLNLVPKDVEKALDLGCGSGSLSVLMANHVQRLIAIDISPSLISMAKEHRLKNSVSNLELLVADAEKLPFREHSFDFVFSYGVLHHTDIDHTLLGIGRLVKPGGKAVIFDYVMSNPRLNAYPVWHIVQALRSAPVYFNRYGVRVMWRIVLFRMSRAWLRHVCGDLFLTKESFESIFRKHFPNCKFKRYSGLMVATWKSPSTVPTKNSNSIS